MGPGIGQGSVNRLLRVSFSRGAGVSYPLVYHIMSRSRYLDFNCRSVRACATAAA